MNPIITSLSSGLILIKRAIPLKQQLEVTKKILQLGEDPIQGFRIQRQSGERALNSTDYRGRMYGQIHTFGKEVEAMPKQSLEMAVALDPTLRMTQPTHLIALFYQTLYKVPPKGYIPWHQDNGDNDGSADYPVVSFSIGDSCDFLICDQKPKIATTHPASNPANLAHRILFESGDALVFGGAKRHMWHAIYTIHPHTAPQELPFKDGRLNFTFRYTPELIGKEENFKTVRAEQLSKDNQFFKLSKMGR